MAVAGTVLVLGLLVSLVPGIAQRAEYGAERFRDRAGYADRVLHGHPMKRTEAQLPFAVAHTGTASILYGAGRRSSPSPLRVRPLAAAPTASLPPRGRPSPRPTDRGAQGCAQRHRRGVRDVDHGRDGADRRRLGLHASLRDRFASVASATGTVSPTKGRIWRRTMGRRSRTTSSTRHSAARVRARRKQPASPMPGAAARPAARAERPRTTRTGRRRSSRSGPPRSGSKVARP